MFGHRGWVVVLRSMLLLQSVESRVPTNMLKQSAIPKTDMWERKRVVVIFGSEQLTSSELRESNKTMDEVINDGCEFDPGGAHNQYSSKWSDKELFNSWHTEAKVWNKRWYDREVGSISSNKDDIKDVRIFGPLFLPCLYFGVERVGCALCVLSMPDGRHSKVYQWLLSPIWGAMGR